MNYSYSSLKTYETCPKKFYFTYVDPDRVKQADDATIELFLGKRVHETLEILYNKLDEYVFSASELTEIFDYLWYAKWTNDVKIPGSDKPAQHWLEIGHWCLSEYHKRFRPFNHHQLLGTEQRIKIKLENNDDYNMVGVVDRIEKVSENAVAIHDYKTGKKMPSQTEVDKDRQLAAYAIGVREMYPWVEEVILVWHYLQHNQDMISYRTKAQLEQLKLDIKTDIDVIKLAKVNNDFPTKKSRLCDWCGFKSICPAHQQ